MKIEKQKELIQKFPILYGLCDKNKKSWRFYLEKENNKSETYHCMTLFGFECGDGWIPLIEQISEKIESYNKSLSDDCEPILALQVKEKFGGLCYYINYGTDEIFDFINEIEKKSFTICEKCGKSGILKQENYWLYTSCNDCDN